MRLHGAFYLPDNRALEVQYLQPYENRILRPHVLIDGQEVLAELAHRARIALMCLDEQEMLGCRRVGGVECERALECIESRTEERQLWLRCGYEVRIERP